VPETGSAQPTGAAQAPPAGPDPGAAPAGPAEQALAEGFAAAAAALGTQRPEPLDPPMTPFAVAGIVAWAVAGLVLLPVREEHPSWLWTCLAGFLFGFLGLAVMLRHDAHRRRRQQHERPTPADQ
jgi:membrane associated rhomboid family serine protease